MLNYIYIAEDIMNNYVGNLPMDEETEKVVEELKNQNKYGQIEKFLEEYKEIFNGMDYYDLVKDREEIKQLAELIENLMKQVRK